MMLIIVFLSCVNRINGNLFGYASLYTPNLYEERDLYLKYTSDTTNSSSTSPRILNVRGGVASHSFSATDYISRYSRSKKPRRISNLREYNVNAFSTADDASYRIKDNDDSPPGSPRKGNSKEREQLYEAYNLLHSLAQVLLNCIFSFIESFFPHRRTFINRSTPLL